MKLFVPIILFLMFSEGQAAPNTPFQPLGDIKETAKQFAAEFAQERTTLPVEISVGKIDPRLKLTACNQPLKGYNSPGNRGIGNILVGVRCESPKPWSLYVPVTIKAYAEVPVASYSIPRGKRLTASDIELQRKEISTLQRGYLESTDSIIGHITRRTIRQGSPFTPMSIKRDQVVKRGQTINIIAKKDGFSVRAQGEAQRDGAIGDIIPIKNLKSKRVVDAKITSAGTAEILF